MKKIVCLFFTFLLFSIISPRQSLAVIFFSDDFENGDASNWVPSTAGWAIENIQNSLRYGTIINTGGTTRESYAGDVNWQNYIYKVDMLALQGEDKNLIFRVIDNKTKYGLHMRSDLAVLEIYDPKRGYFEKFNYGVGFVNGTLYHLKIIVNGENIKVYSNNNLLFDYTDIGTNITHGKIGLRVTTGAVHPTSAWFDNVIVCSLDDPCELTQPFTPTPIPPTSTPTPIPPTPTPTPLTPVVFVPGLGGSFNFNKMFLNLPGEWKITPGANVYKNIFKAFEGNPNFYPFYYDWRKPVLDNVNDLDNFIKNTVKPLNNKVNLIGHSLGGLLARACVQETDDHCSADKLITVGSPNLGVVEAYPAVEAGEIWRTGVMKMAFELLIHYYQRPGETRRETLLRVAPVMNDLLPNFNYLYRGGSSVSWETLSVQNPLLPLLSNLTSLQNIAKTIYGNSYSTLNFLTLKDTDILNKTLGNWPDGEPVGTVSTSNEGDGTVLSLSSKLDQPYIENFSLNLDHGAIISDKTVLEKIFSLIGYELPSNTFSPLNEEENYLVFLVHSPVKISLSDLPENAYSENELIIIPNPQHNTYTLNVTALAGGYYQLSTGQIYSHQVLWHDYVREVRNEQLQFVINPENPQGNPLVESEGQIRDSLAVALDEFGKEIKESSIKSAHQKVLLNFLEKFRQGDQNNLSFLNNLSSLRNQFLIFEKNNFLDREIALLFRDKASRIAGILETLAFQNPEKINKNQAVISIEVTEETKESIIVSNLTREGVIIYLEAQEKLDKARGALGKGEYWQAWIYAQEAKDLFLEAPKAP